MTSSVKMFSVTRRFAVGELITLFQIDLTTLGGKVYYFTNNIFEEGVAITFGGKTYDYMPVALDDIDTGTDSGPAQPHMTIATAGGPVSALIYQYKDLRGAKITRLRTFAEFLDTMPDGNGNVVVNPGADSSALLPIDIFMVDRKVAANKTMAEFQLVAPTDQEGVQLPLRVIKKRYCDKVYRFNSSGHFIYDNTSNPCPYKGTAYFDLNDQSTTAGSDACSKTLGGCTKRFGAGALPFGGFPGVKSPGEAG
jgi:lambda family phage minor tail protein L